MTHVAPSRPKVLAIAEAANPEWVSVPLVGWSLAETLREVADVHLVTQVRNRDAILRAGWVEGRDFTAIDSEAVARPLWALAERLRMGDGKGWTTLQAVSALIYPWFEHLVWKTFGPAIKAGDYDIVHRITPLSPTISSPIAQKVKAAGVPFVIGPLNGGIPWPKQFEAERRAEKEWLSYFRDAYKYLPGRKHTLESAAAIIVASGHTYSEVPEVHHHKTVYIPENGINPDKFQSTAMPKPDVLSAAFVGRLVPLKGVDMLIEAAADLLRQGRMTLDIIGDGPVADQLKSIAKTRNCEASIVFHGWVPHERVQATLRKSHVLTFPSIKEFGGGVILEAMALGVVPIVVDYAGPGELVTQDTGLKVPCSSRRDIIAGFKKVLENLAQHPEQLEAKACRAQTYVQSHFLWSRKAEQVSEVYQWVMSGRQAEKPDPFASGSDHNDVRSA